MNIYPPMHPSLEFLTTNLCQLALSNQRLQKIYAQTLRIQDPDTIAKSFYCTITSDKKIRDNISPHEDQFSSHAYLNVLELTKKRSALSLKILSEISSSALLYGDNTPLRIILELTPAINPACSFHIEHLNVHPRPIKPSYLAKKLFELLTLFSRISASPFGSLKDYVVFHNAINRHLLAPNPGEAFWKFLCLVDRDLARSLAKTDNPLLEISRLRKSTMQSSYVRENFSINECLAPLFADHHKDT